MRRELARSASKDGNAITDRRTLTLRDYVKRRNGVPLGAPGSLQNMLHRAFGARSFANFWQHWNPIFGYYLGSRVFVSLKRLLPPWAALILTFVVTGIIHDVVTMAVRRDIAFLFTPWFLVMGSGVVLSNVAGMDIGARPWALRAVTNTAYLVISLALALIIFPIR